jgi:transposase
MTALGPVGRNNSALVSRRPSRPTSCAGRSPERDGVSAWRLVDLCEHVERTYGVHYSEWGLSCLLKRLTLSRQKTRPSHPKGDPAAQAAFKKGAALKAEGHRGGAS